MLPLLTALALVCSGATPGTLSGDHKPPEPRTHTEAGAAPSDTAHQLAAKLSSLNGIVRVGVGLFLCGLLSLSYPPLRALVRNSKTSVALLVGGVALIILPSLVLGNERLILGVGVLACGAWYLVRSRQHGGRRPDKRVHGPHAAPWPLR